MLRLKALVVFPNIFAKLRSSSPVCHEQQHRQSDLCSVTRMLCSLCRALPHPRCLATVTQGSQEHRASPARREAGTDPAKCTLVAATNAKGRSKQRPSDRDLIQPGQRVRQGNCGPTHEHCCERNAEDSANCTQQQTLGSRTAATRCDLPRPMPNGLRTLRSQFPPGSRTSRSAMFTQAISRIRLTAPSRTSSSGGAFAHGLFLECSEISL